jgi:hypothetical protein
MISRPLTKSTAQHRTRQSGATLGRGLLVEEHGIGNAFVVAPVYSIRAMPWGTVELEPEVRDLVRNLSTARFATAAFYIDLSAAEGPSGAAVPS